MNHTKQYLKLNCKYNQQSRQGLLSGLNPQGFSTSGTPKSAPWRDFLFQKGFLMKTTQKHRTIEKPQAVEYIDENGVLWESSTLVCFNYKYEILGVRITCLEGFDSEGTLLSTVEHLTKGTLDNIEEHAGNLALEKLDSEDFIPENEEL